MSNRPVPGLSIGALSRRTGCSIETIRYYERIALLPAPPRSPGGHRLYDHNHLKRLTFIRHGRALGFTLDELRALLGLVDDGNYTCGEVLARAGEHLAGIRQRIQNLQRLEKTLEGIAARCQGGGLTECPIIDTLFDIET